VVVAGGGFWGAVFDFLGAGPRRAAASGGEGAGHRARHATRASTCNRRTLAAEGTASFLVAVATARTRRAARWGPLARTVARCAGAAELIEAIILAGLMWWLLLLGATCAWGNGRAG